MNENLLQLFVQLITDYAGLYVRSMDYGNLCQKLLLRIKHLKLRGPEDYYQLLSTPGNSSDLEWQKLLVLLTTTESYFFRDKGQFQILRNTILPDIINRRLRNHEKTIRIWSAGCSTGEEPYSMAILLQELLTDWPSWNLVIVGADANQEVLEKAERGVYSDWSFRMVDPHIKTRYFTPYKGEWKIQDNVRQMVKFQYHNLLKNNGPERVDLILCRNVLVYFEHDAITKVINRFHNSLLPHGYLITAHAELHGQEMKGFQIKVFPESLVYQRIEDKRWNGETNHQSPIFASPSDSFSSSYNTAGTSTQVSGSDRPSISLDSLDHSFGKKIDDRHMPIAPSTKTPVQLSLKQESLLEWHENYGKKDTKSHKIQPKNIEKLLADAYKSFESKSYNDAIKKAEKILHADARNFAAHCLLAQVHANLGHYDQASEYCQKALEIDVLAIRPYYLLAHIAEERGDLDGAKILLKRVIYLSPKSISAYLHLADIYEKEGDQSRANKMKSSALEMLEKLPPNDLIEHNGQIRASEFIEYLRKVLVK